MPRDENYLRYNFNCGGQNLRMTLSTRLSPPRSGQSQDHWMNKNQRIRILLTTLVFVVALYRYFPVPSALGPCNIGYESLNLSCSLARTGNFSNPYGVLPTGPSAHLAPLFPWMVSLLIRRLGDEPAVSNILVWMAALTLALQLSLWPWIAGRLGMGFAPGLIAAALWLCVGFGLYPEWEATYVALLILILVLCTNRLLKKQVSTAFVSMTSILWGTLFLLNPVPLLVYLAITIWAVFFSKIRRAQKLALMLIPLAILSPWLVRNYEVFHHFILIRDNLGTELWLANNPCSTFSFNVNRSIKCFDHPNESIAEARKLAASGEYEYNQAKLRDALAWIKDNPRKFASLTRQRFLAYWFFSPRGIFFDGRHLPLGILILWAVTPLSLAGLWMLFKKDRTAAGLCLVWMLLFPPIYYLLSFTPRYRFPLLWVSFIPASFVLSEAGQNVWHRLRKYHGASAAPVQTAVKSIL
jgi:hypothetical protein